MLNCQKNGNSEMNHKLVGNWKKIQKFAKEIKIPAETLELYLKTLSI